MNSNLRLNIDTCIRAYKDRKRPTPRGFFCVWSLSFKLMLSLFQCLTSSELYSFAGSDRSKQLNSTDFVELSPAFVYCLLPAPERNAGRCTLSPKNHSELFNSFKKNFSQHGEQGITPEALDGILEAINKTIGQYLNKTKVGYWYFYYLKIVLLFFYPSINVISTKIFLFELVSMNRILFYFLLYIFINIWITWLYR